LLESIHRRKTGALFTASLRLGAIVGGADSRSLAALTEYGDHLGLAFQIVDDLLDVDGNSEDLGKQTGKDDRRGKLTFPGLLGVAESRRRAETLIAGARAALAPLGERGAALALLAAFVLERNR
jgi:geranylgeranyl diphosphate synthase type II